MKQKQIDIPLPQWPELVFGLVAPVGTPLGRFTSELESALSKRTYSVRTFHLSNYLEGLDLGDPPSPNDDAYTRISKLMDLGNALRELCGSGEALALFPAAEIEIMRPRSGSRVLDRHSFILRQLKHPDEVKWLRQVYGSSFFLIGLKSLTESRQENLCWLGMTEDEANRLIDRDEGEEARWGQQLRDTYCLADAFIDLDAPDDHIDIQVQRLLTLIFGEDIVVPTLHEYGMSVAHVAALRSSDLSRQVGAAILTENGEVLALGCNDAPKFGGGQYWTESGEGRDRDIGFDSNTIMKRENLKEVLERTYPRWGARTESERDSISDEFLSKLRGTRVMNLTEFGRSVHAELEAMLSAGRVGTCVKEALLFSTTFPCHNCAKHIIAAGIQEVTYIEPYPKSLAEEMHSDALTLKDEPGKVRFRSFVGIAPRRYQALFGTVLENGKRIARKDNLGFVLRNDGGVRLQENPANYIQREAIAAALAKEIGRRTTKEGSE